MKTKGEKHEQAKTLLVYAKSSVEKNPFLINLSISWQLITSLNTYMAFIIDVNVPLITVMMIFTQNNKSKKETVMKMKENDVIVTPSRTALEPLLPLFPELELELEDEVELEGDVELELELLEQSPEGDGLFPFLHVTHPVCSTLHSRHPRSTGSEEAGQHIPSGHFTQFTPSRVNPELQDKQSEFELSFSQL